MPGQDYLIDEPTENSLRDDSVYRAALLTIRGTGLEARLGRNGRTEPETPVAGVNNGAQADRNSQGGRQNGSNQHRY